MKWFDAPIKTQWGDDMVVSSVEIDKDHTLDLYCEGDMIPFVIEALQKLIKKELDARTIAS